MPTKKRFPFVKIGHISFGPFSTCQSLFVSEISDSGEVDEHVWCSEVLHDLLLTEWNLISQCGSM